MGLPQLNLKTKKATLVINTWYLTCGLLTVFLLNANIVGSQTVSKIAAGSAHSLFLKSDGSLWAMGANGFGQLGDGTFNNTNSPEKIVATNVTKIAGGGSHSLFVRGNGSLWAMGANR